MNCNRYLYYESASTHGGYTFYVFRIVLIDDTLLTLLYLLGSSAPSELRLIDIAVLAPAQITTGQEFQIFNSGSTWTAPENMAFLYARGSVHVSGPYPTGPDSEDVSVGLALVDRPALVYVNTDPENVSEWPPGDSPAETNPDPDTGYAFPPYANFQYVTKGVATRYLNPFFYTDVETRYNFVWGGCSDYLSDENHVLNNWPADSVVNNLLHRWNTPHFIYCCNENTWATGYWVVRTGSNPEHLFFYAFESSDEAYYYPHLVTIPPGGVHTLVPFLAAEILGLNLLNATAWRLMRRYLPIASVFIPRPFASNNQPLGSGTSQPIGGKDQ